MQFTAIIHGGAQLFGPSSLPGSAGLLPSFGTDGTFSAWVAAGSHAEGDAHSGGTSGGIVYVDASGNIATDGPTVSADGLTTSSGILTATAPAADKIPLQITGYAAQSENLTEWAVSGGAVKAVVNAAGEFTHATTSATGESFGSGAVATYGKSTAVGSSANCGNASSTAIGADADAGAYGLAIGYNASAIGGNWNTSRTALGTNTVSGHSSTICIGAYSESTATNQFVAGSQYNASSNVYFGLGVTNATPTAYTIHGTGGSGTDIAGADINIAGGIGTGTGVGGDITFQYAAAGLTTGSTANTLATAMTIDGASGDITASGDLTLSSPTVPASASATGVAGTISFDSDYIYICTATNTWKRVAIATW